MHAILSLPGHLGSFLGTLFLSNTSCQWQNETWITKFCMQNFILKRLGDNFHKKCLVFITLPANLIGTQLEMSYRQHWHPAVSQWEKLIFLSLNDTIIQGDFLNWASPENVSRLPVKYPSHTQLINDYYGFLTNWETLIMTLRVSDWQSESKLDGIRNLCDVSS